MLTYLQGLDGVSLEEALGVLRLMRDSNDYDVAKTALGIAVECVAQSIQAVEAQKALQAALQGAEVPPGTELAAPASAPKGARRKPAKAALDESRKPPRGSRGSEAPKDGVSMFG